MPKKKQNNVNNQLLENALKELDALAPKEAPKDREVLEAADKTSVPKKKVTKAVKAVSKKKDAKPNKPPVTVKRVDEGEAAIKLDNGVVVRLVEDSLPLIKDQGKDKVVTTKTVVKDGMVIVEPVSTPFDD